MKNSKPSIGITRPQDNGFLMWYCAQYLIKRAGAKTQQLTIDVDQSTYEQCDGYVLSGGNDIDPYTYGQDNTASINISSKRDQIELEIIEHALKHNKPMLGICRGAQLINVACGGTLHQNALDFYDGFVPTDSILGKIFKRKKIVVKPGTHLHRMMNAPTLNVNSLHHQAIDKLGEGLIVSANDQYGMIQAIEYPEDDKFVIGLQWHPEFMPHSFVHRRVFRKLVHKSQILQTL